MNHQDSVSCQSTPNHRISWRQLQDPENRENRNAGNGGDLVKHTVYLTTLDYFLGQSPWSNGLRVRECHAGRGMYAIPRDDARRALLEGLYDPADADMDVFLHDMQRASQCALRVWPSNLAALEWYSGSAVLNAWRLKAATAGSHLLEVYELAPDTREILRAVFKDLRLRSLKVDVRIPPDPEDHRDFDGELHIENNISTWGSQDLVLLDPFAMWRQDQDQLRRDRYGRIIDSLLGREEDSPLLSLFWTWGQAFPAADGDLKDTNTRVRHGYQDLRDRLHRVGRRFIRVAWRWGLQFAMWILVPDSHLIGLSVALQQRCSEMRDHLLRRGCRGRLTCPDVEVIVD